MSHPIETLLLLGASGDLASRLLLPALGKLLDAEPDRRDLLVLGAGAEAWDQEAWRERVRASFAAAQVSQETTDAVLATTRYEQADVTQSADLERLFAASAGAPALYFALPPAVTLAACRAMTGMELPPGTVLVLEKPFGTDAASADSLNALLTQLVPESQVHRVDHFLGRSTVFNLLGVRFANRIFGPVWNRDHVERVDIVFDEDLTLEDRARYYDHAGALVDMIQSHLLQVMAVVAMEPVATLDEVDFRGAKSDVLRATRVWGGDPVRAARRARYTAGAIGERQVPDYVAEPGVDPARDTETLAEVTVEVANQRWAGVPFRLRSGKSLGRRRKEVLVTFRPLAHLPTGFRGHPVPDQLRLLMGPDALSLEMNVNGPGDPLDLEQVALRTDLNPGWLPAYGEVLSGVLDGDPLLSVRGDNAVQCWRIVDPVLAAWRSGETPLDTYPAGSEGPDTWTATAAPSLT